MAGKIMDKNSEEWKIFAEFWNLFKEYGTVENTVSYWESVISAFGSFGRKYENTTLARNLAIAMVNTLEADAKAKSSCKEII